MIPNEYDEPSRGQLVMLLALDRRGKHVYAGTVPERVKSKRRAKNKVARVSRRKNRERGRAENGTDLCEWHGRGHVLRG